MQSMPSPPRRVLIGDAAAFVGITPRTIRYYHQLGLLPEAERGSDGRRRYGYSDIVRLLWLRRMADAGIALVDIRAATRVVEADDVDDDTEMVDVLARLEESLAAKERELRQKRASIQRMRTLGSRHGLLNDVVTRRLEEAPEGSLRQDDLDDLLVTERLLGPLGAAIRADRFLALASDPQLRAKSDRIDEAERALDDSVDVDDPRVAQVAAERRAFEQELMRVVERSERPDVIDGLLERWEEDHPPENSGSASDSANFARVMSAAEAVRRLPSDLSPARARAMELASETLIADVSSPTGTSGSKT